MTPFERILALLNGEPVGEACLAENCAYHLHYGPPCNCKTCNGTGRIRTTPEGPVEEAAARLRAERDGLDHRADAYDRDRQQARQERDDARAQLSIERATGADRRAADAVLLEQVRAQLHRLEVAAIGYTGYPDRAAERIETLQASLTEALAQRDQLLERCPPFWCPECDAPCLGVDEDGLCVACGAEPIPPKLRLTEALARAERAEADVEIWKDRCAVGYKAMLERDRLAAALREVLSNLVCPGNLNGVNDAVRILEAALRGGGAKC